MTRRDVVWVLCFLISGALGLTCFVQFYDRAFPVASLNFRADREQAYQAAGTYLHRLGYDLTEFESAQVFSYASLSQIFLERTLGLAEANRLVREWVSVWFWHVRYFKPLQKEEFRVRIDPGGRVVGFSHSVLESDEGASLPEEDARRIAEAFLADVQGFSLNAYEPIGASSTDRPKRTDHTFTYRKRDFVVGDDGHYRLHVTVQGDRVGSFYEYLKVPETFSRDYREIRTRAGRLAQVAGGFSLALAIAMIVVLVRKFRQRTLTWRVAVFIGILVGAVSLLGSINGYPISLFGHDTMQSYVSFILNFIFDGLLGAAVMALIVAVCGTAGSAAAQDVRDWSNPLARVSLRRWRSAGFARVTLVGYGLAFAHLGYVTLFYILGNDYLGVWSPAKITQYSNAYSTYLPWIYPLLTGLVAATVEEFLFRLVAISLLLRWLKRSWLAVLVSAVVWAFLHADYPQQPIYIRGLELTIVGILLGIVFLRFGVWATIISHYVYNCFLGVYPMLQSDSLYFKISGILAVAIISLPALPAIWSAVRGRYVDEHPEPIPDARKAAPPPSAGPAEPPEPPIERKRPSDYLISGKGLLVFGILGLLGWSAHFAYETRDFAEYAREKVPTRAQAIEIAEGIREQFGLDLEGYRRTTSFSSSLGSKHFTHLLRNVDAARADTLAAEHTASWRWSVRWFKPLEKEELTISVDGHGGLSYISHAVPEGQEGAELTIEEAREVAVGFLRQHLNRDVSDTTLYKRLEARSFKRENRMDHSFVWERTDIKVEDGEFRIVASVQGDRIGRAYTAYKAPEEFLRKQGEKTAKSTIVSTLRTIALTVTLVLAAIYLLRAYRSGLIEWRLPICVGILFGLCTLLEDLNELPTFYQGYDTSQIMGTFLVGKLVDVVPGLAFAAIFALLICALGDTLFRTERPAEMRISEWIDVLRLKAGNAALWWQVVLLVACYSGMRKGASVLSTHVRLNYLDYNLVASGGAPPSVNTYLPAFGELVDEFSGMLISPIAILGLLFIWWRILGKTSLMILGVFVVLVFQFVISPANDIYHAGELLATSSPIWLISAFLILKYIRFNLLFYVVTAWSSILFVGIRYLELDANVWKINGILMVLFGLVPVVFAVIVRLRERRSNHPCAFTPTC